MNKDLIVDDHEKQQWLIWMVLESYKTVDSLQSRYISHSMSCSAMTIPGELRFCMKPSDF
jgi:hypothetical protein